MRPSLSDRVLKSVSLAMEKLPRWLTSHKKISWATFLVVFVVLVAGGERFKINQTMEAFFNDDDPTLVRYNWFKYVFGSDEFVLIMYAPKNGDVFSHDSLALVKKVEDELRQRAQTPGHPLSRLKRVRSLVSADYLESRADTLISRPFIGDNLPKSPVESDAIRQLALAHKDYPGSFFSRDSRYGVLMIETDFGAIVKASQKDSTQQQPEDDDFDFDAEDGVKGVIPLDEVPGLQPTQMEEYPPFVQALRDTFDEADWSKHNDTFLAGNPILMEFFDRVLLKQIGLFSGLAVVIIWLVMLVAFRSLSALAWPTVTLVVSMTALVGLIGWTGQEMTFMINIISFLLLAVSMAISIHVLSGYRFYMAKGIEPDKALDLTYYRAGVPIILAGVTTAIGLVSLVFVPIPAIRNFGMFASIGVLFTIVSNICLWPLLIAIWAPKMKTERAEQSTMLSRFLGTQLPRCRRWRWQIIVIFIAITGFFAMGLPKVYIDTNFLKMIKSGYNITEGYEIIDEHFGGTAAIEVLLDTKSPDGVKSSAFLKSVEAFEDKVMSMFPDDVPRVRSIVNVVKESYKNLGNGTEADYRIPDKDLVVAQTLVSFESADPTRRRLMVDDSWQMARVTFSVVSGGTQHYSALLDGIAQAAKTFFAESTTSAKSVEMIPTGGVALMVKLLSLISVAQLKSFSLALLVICLLLFILFGSLKFGILAVIPNIFPLLVAGGSAGWLGFPLDSDTLLVMPIAIGIAVDDTIHFLTHYKSELVDGAKPADAIKGALAKVGQAMFFTTVVLSLGFLVFVLSAYNPLSHFGILSAIAISSALLADIFLLPVLMEMFEPADQSPEVNA